MSEQLTWPQKRALIDCSDGQRSVIKQRYSWKATVYAGKYGLKPLRQIHYLTMHSLFNRDLIKLDEADGRITLSSKGLSALGHAAAEDLEGT